MVCDKYWIVSCFDICEIDLLSGIVVRSRFGCVKCKILFWNLNILINKLNILF